DGVLDSSGKVYRHLRRRLAFLEHEAFVVLCLDARNQVIAEVQVAQGSATSVEVHPREVFMPAVREAAAALIVAHNHPSGDPEPSDDDLHLTERLRRAARLLGIPLLDHLVITRRGFVSLAERGVL
ncbi:MAG: DNA repair protein RadC, partial [Myxococcales bacterium]|nr:DNA repair protein RadC [Myxococcales bacterium]